MKASIPGGSGEKHPIRCTRLDCTAAEYLNAKGRSGVIPDRPSENCFAKLWSHFMQKCSAVSGKMRAPLR